MNLVGLDYRLYRNACRVYLSWLNMGLVEPSQRLKSCPFLESVRHQFLQGGKPKLDTIIQGLPVCSHLKCGEASVLTYGIEGLRSGARYKPGCKCSIPKWLGIPTT